MIFDTPTLFASLAVLVASIRYGTYLWSMFKGETHPHIFSWFNWGVMVSIGAYAQHDLGGGPSAWALTFVAALCFFIAFVSLFVGEKNITRSDWFAFLAALAAIPIWKATDNPLAAIAIVITIDALTYYPTIRKSYHKPWSEPPMSYFWAGLRYFLILFAVPNPSFDTLLYPVFLMVSDWGFGLYIVWRRWAISRRIP